MRIIIADKEICLFCGEEKKELYSDCEQYWECDCPDAKRDREIYKEIRKLNQSRPSNKYEIFNARILRKI